MPMKTRHSSSAPSLGGSAGSPLARSSLPPPPSPQVILRSEKGIPAPGPVAAWAGSLRAYLPSPPKDLSSEGLNPTSMVGAQVAGLNSRGGSPRVPERADLGLPPSLLRTFARTAELQNEDNASRMRRLGLPQAPQLMDTESIAGRVRERQLGIMAQRMAQHSSLVGYSTEDEYVREAELVSDSVDKLRQRHAMFEPLSPAEAARRELLRANDDSDPSPSKRARPRLSPEEMLERFEMLKYVRKIEPELPPLERPEKKSEPPSEQGLVLFNSTSAAVQRWRPEARLEMIASKATERTARHRLVVDQRNERRNAALTAKRQSAEKAAQGKLAAKAARSGSEELPPGCLAELCGFKNAWFAILAMVSFAQCAKAELQFCKMGCRQRHEYVTIHWNSLSTGFKAAGNTIRLVMDLKQKMDEPHFANRLALFSAMVTGRLRLKRMREAAKCVSNCLNTWNPGSLLMYCRKIALRIRLVQVNWRVWRRQIRERRKKVSTRWLHLERQIIVREIREEKNKSKAKEILSLEGQIACKRVEDGARLQFLTHEMRARRWMLLPHISLWEDECRMWEAAVREHRQMQEVTEFLGGDAQEDAPLFLFPPAQPSHMPNDEDILDMIFRCRESSDNWTPIPQDPAGVWAQRDAARQV